MTCYPSHSTPIALAAKEISQRTHTQKNNNNKKKKLATGKREFLKHYLIALYVANLCTTTAAKTKQNVPEERKERKKNVQRVSWGARRNRAASIRRRSALEHRRRKLGSMPLLASPFSLAASNIMRASAKH